MKNQFKWKKSLLIALIILVLVLIFYPKKYQHGGPVGPDTENSKAPICFGFSDSDMIPGLTKGICYGILIKSNNNPSNIKSPNLISNSRNLSVDPFDLMLDETNNSLVIKDKDTCIDSASKIIKYSYKGVNFQYTNFYFNPENNSCITSINIHYPNSISWCHSASVIIDVNLNKNILFRCVDVPTENTLAKYFDNSDSELKEITEKDYNDELLIIKKYLIEAQGIQGSVYTTWYTGSGVKIFNDWNNLRISFNLINSNNTSGVAEPDKYGNFSLNLMPGSYNYFVSNIITGDKYEITNENIVQVERNKYNNLFINLGQLNIKN